MLDLKRKVTDGSKTLRVQRLSATTGVKRQIFEKKICHLKAHSKNYDKLDIRK